MAHPVVIGGLSFRTKSEAKRFFGAIRNRYPDSAKLSPEDESVVRDLLACHPESAEKTGAGAAFFTVETDALFGRTRHFVVHRSDGTSSDFSYHACIDGRNERRDRLGAMRRAVEDQIIAFREMHFASPPQLCPLRRFPITRESYHVDHAPPVFFTVLVGRWLDTEGLQLPEVRITLPGDNQIVATMTDPSQSRSWRGYHRLNARLRMLSPRANLSDARRNQ